MMQLANEYTVDTAPDFTVKRNRHGFYQLDPIPSEKELQEYYAQKYYQNAKGSYSHSYDDDELEFIRGRSAEKELLIKKFYTPASDGGGG